MAYAVPVDGNNNYTGIIRVAEQLPNIQINNGIIPNLVSETINSQFVWENPSPSNAYKIMSVTGHSPRDFLGSAAGTSFFLNVNPGQPTTTSVEGGVLVLPPNATIIGAYVIDSTLTGPAVIRIGTCELRLGAQDSSNIISTFATNINDGRRVLAKLSPVGLGTAGARVFSNTIQVSETETTGVTITHVGLSPVTATSGVRVVIYYLLTPPPGSS